MAQEKSIFDHHSYYFIGIGGIGTSAIARMLNLKEKKVEGSDSSHSEITDDLEKIGIKVNIGQRAENIPEGVEVVIHTIAIPETNPELIEAKKRGVLVVSYPQALGNLSKDMFTIAISGTHGKTTSTAMLGHIMMKAGFDPTIVVGSKLIGADSNFIAGKSRYLIAEACEYKRSFLNLSPKILAITNIEADHLDYYKDIDDIKNAFREIALKVPEDGFIVTNLSEENIKSVISDLKAQILDYNSIDSEINLLVPGEHNIVDAKIAIKCAEALGIDEKMARESLEDFRGTWRRLEYKGEKNGDIIYDDYAHHPTEVEASIKALRQKYPDRKIICVFKPHTQGRVKKLFKDFVTSLSLADEAIIIPIYIARETPDNSISNKILAEALNKFIPADSVETVDELKKKLSQINRDKPLCIIMMGAGDIYEWTKEL